MTGCQDGVLTDLNWSIRGIRVCRHARKCSTQEPTSRFHGRTVERRGGKKNRIIALDHLEEAGSEIERSRAYRNRGGTWLVLLARRSSLCTRQCSFDRRARRTRPRDTTADLFFELAYSRATHRRNGSCDTAEGLRHREADPKSIMRAG